VLVVHPSMPGRTLARYHALARRPDWMKRCAAGALEHLDLDWVDYFPGYRTSAGTGTGLYFASWA
jgi:hypothetical protein